MAKMYSENGMHERDQKRRAAAKGCRDICCMTREKEREREECVWECDRKSVRERE